MATKVSAQENLSKLTTLFGNPIGKTPLISSELTNEIGTVFWADETIWTVNKLRNLSHLQFKIFGPFYREDAPFTAYIPPCDGFVIFVPDKD